MNYYGLLIRRERLRRDWSQAGLCRGICTVSYLSKIEQGKASPSTEVVRLLLERLALHVDDEIEAEAESAAGTGYERLLSGDFEGLKQIAHSFDNDRYKATTVALSIELLYKYATDDWSPLDDEYESCMEPRELMLQRMLQGRYEEAVRLTPNAYTRFSLGVSQYEKGDYPDALESLQTAYDMAAQEGRAGLMLEAKMVMGNCHCNTLNMRGMEAHYRVAYRLASALKRQDLLDTINYNTASAQIETGEYEKAYRYFSELKEHTVMTLHKLAICCENTGRKTEALSALDAAETNGLQSIDKSLARQMCELVRCRLEHEDYLDRSEYGKMLLDCYNRCRAELPAGYASFHLPWVIEWYKAIRRYKEAYELLSKFPNK
ncbi:MAG TPA: helix-turn-helix domain-containing protein [Eubacteriales bacterium]|nr:helix-turn-helix domain-containing protein [Clostridia bacterium]HRV73573.1 helix-turn-helix domain-containing protein [Eubacteriales bacterium]